MNEETFVEETLDEEMQEEQIDWILKLSDGGW